ncbi:helix-turn-helix transcriptional regulator [Flavobacteriaceae bacterium M23B6Z8]
MNDRMASEELKEICTFLSGDIRKINGITQWIPKPSIGDGSLRYASLDKDIDAFEIHLKMFDETKLNFASLQEETIFFVYCLKGECWHKFSEENKAVQLEKFQTAVVLQNKEIKSEVILQAASDVVLSVIRMNKSFYFDRFEDIEDTDRFKVLADLMQEKHMHLHLGMSNLEIGEQVKLLEKIKHKTSTSLVLRFEGLCQLILANQIDQFIEEMEEEYKPSSLTNRELDRLQKLSEHISNHPELPHCLRSLSLYSGLSPAKLQEGFKFLHNRTVADCIRNIRLEKAEMLIRTTDLNISEIVYTIGLTSRSYFCKCFKEKYKCSPKQYKTRIKESLQST